MVFQCKRNWEDKFENMGAQMVKEASKTNDITATIFQAKRSEICIC